MVVGCLLNGCGVGLCGRVVAAMEADGFVFETQAEIGAFRTAFVAGRYGVVVLHHSHRAHAAVLDALRDLRRPPGSTAVPLLVAGAGPLPGGDRVALLEAGADEVLDAAMLVSEAVARVRAVLRRTRGAPDAAPPAPAPWRLSAAVRRMEAPDGGSHRLTAAEFALLRLLVAASGEAVDRDAISRVALRRPWQPEDRAVDGLVRRLRRKLGPDAIQSSRGLGYALTLRVHSA